MAICSLSVIPVETGIYL